MSDPGRRGRIADAATSLLVWLTAMVVVAGVTHIVSILAMPRLAPRDAFARMEALAPLNQTTLLTPEDAQSQPPIDDPALARGVCRYDLAQGPLRLRATLPVEELTMLSFHARYGGVFYSMTDRGATRGRLDVLLLTQPQLDDVEANDDEDALPSELRIVAPSLRGFVLFRALAQRASDYEDARSRIAAIACGLDRNVKS